MIGLGGGLTLELYGRGVAPPPDIKDKVPDKPSDKTSDKDKAPDRVLDKKGNPWMAQEVSDVRQYAPSGDKKAAKTYCIAAHPVRPGQTNLLYTKPL